MTMTNDRFGDLEVSRFASNGITTLRAVLQHYVSRLDATLRNSSHCTSHSFIDLRQRYLSLRHALRRRVTHLYSSHQPQPQSISLGNFLIPALRFAALRAVSLRCTPLRKALYRSAPRLFAPANHLIDFIRQFCIRHAPQ